MFYLKEGAISFKSVADGVVKPGDLVRYRYSDDIIMVFDLVFAIYNEGERRIILLGWNLTESKCYFDYTLNVVGDKKQITKRINLLMNDYRFIYKQ